MLVTHGYTSSRAAIAISARTRKSRFPDALPHGERPVMAKTPHIAKQFQFALPHGERRTAVVTTALFSRFQFALPHGERHQPFACCARSMMFQFALPHGERRGRCLPRLHRRAVSIRAPAWGATSVERLIADEEQFQFALPHGERLPSCNDRYSLHRKRTIR